ncbi:MAG: zinc ribbon domain-containing protein [Candidatus Heimdallarchaeota archaeon]|nr:MAG: zinc ribbon domain-containing protein [Candidatus Heimdallarchaeota archaeon]
MSLNECPNCGEIVKTNEFFCQRCGTALTSPQRPRTKEIKGYIQIIGTVEIVFGIIGILFGFILLLFAFFVPYLVGTDSFVSNGPSSVDPTVLGGFLGILAGFLAIVGMIFSNAAIVSGVRLMQYKNSGRIGTMVIGAFSIFIFPVGTIFGVIALYILTKPEVEPLFI